jgi:prepilin-type N-terminal cleavage/methylation domain-containing protein
MKSKQAGFTLIEIAIVLVIIGLLLGGVLKGQELINSAKVKNLATDFKNIPVYIYGYQDKFRALPGDDSAAASHVTLATVASTPAECNNLAKPASGNCTGNGLIDGLYTSKVITDEVQLFWQHVRLAGLAPGPTANVDDYRPSNASGGVIGIQSGSSQTGKFPITDGATPSSPIRGTYIICSEGILGKFVKQLDIQMDDGQTNTGSMMAIKSGDAYGSAATAFKDIDDAGAYTVCMGI